MRAIPALLCCFIASTGFSEALRATETVPLKSFSYVSTGCHSKGDLLTFGGIDEFRMTETKPGAGELPEGDFWIRTVSITFFGSDASQFAVVGHSGQNGDWISPSVASGTSQTITFPPDAAPLFQHGEHLDVHAECYQPHWWRTQARAIVSIWYVPAP